MNIGKLTDEMCMLVYLLMKTKLKVCDVLGWFNKNVRKRKEFLRKFNISLEDYEYVPYLFPKTHQTYLLQWKTACLSWIGKYDVTFEMLKRTKKYFLSNEKNCKPVELNDML